MLQVWNELTREELRRVLPEAVVVLPTGATEQHGPYLATGHDTFSVTDIAHRAAEAASGPVVVAPALPFGSSHHHLPFGGTLSLGTQTYYQVVHDLVTSIIASGGRRIFLLNGHGGNQELIVLVARDVALQQPAETPVAIAAASYWQVAEQSLGSLDVLHGIPTPGHAGAFETSTMLATDRTKVRERYPRTDDSRMPVAIPGVRVEISNSWAGFDGYTDDPSLATPEMGTQVLDMIVRDVAAAFDRLAEEALA